MMTKPVNFGSNKNIKRYQYYHYKKVCSESFILAMGYFFNNKTFNRWREILEENNYEKWKGSIRYLE